MKNPVKFFLIVLLLLFLMGCTNEEKLIAKVLEDANAKREDIIYRHDTNNEDFYYFLCLKENLIMYSGTTFIFTNINSKVVVPTGRVKCK